VPKVVARPPRFRLGLARARFDASWRKEGEAAPCRMAKRQAVDDLEEARPPPLQAACARPQLTPRLAMPRIARPQVVTGEIRRAVKRLHTGDEVR